VAWEEDNHAPTWRICDLAAQAIGRLRNGQAGVAPRTNGPATQISAPAVNAPAALVAKPPVIAAMDFQPPQSTPIAPFVPLIAAVLEIPLVVSMFFVEYFSHGQLSADTATTKRMDALFMVPAAIGILIGSIVIARRQPRGPVARVFLGIGCTLCTL